MEGGGKKRRKAGSRRRAPSRRALSRKTLSRRTRSRSRSWAPGRPIASVKAKRGVGKWLRRLFSRQPRKSVVPRKVGKRRVIGSPARFRVKSYSVKRSVRRASPKRSSAVVPGVVTAKPMSVDLAALTSSMAALGLKDK